MNVTLNRMPIAALLISFLWSTSVMAAVVSVVPSGTSSYTIQGVQMNGVAGIQLDIFYDSASLATPAVTQGTLISGAMFAANTTIPGVIKIAIVSTSAFSGSGQIAAISFATKKGNAGITSIKTSMIDSKGSAIASSDSPVAANTDPTGSGLIPTAGVPFSQPSTQASSTTQQQYGSAVVSSGTASATTPAYLGTVTMPGDIPQRTDTPSAIPATPPVPREETQETTASMKPEQVQPPGDSAAAAKTEETPQYVIYEGVLDRFRLYKGNKDLSALEKLFEKRATQPFNQEPAVILSDGKSKVVLIVDITKKSSSSPKFAVNGGTLVSFKQDTQNKNRWVVEVLPETGAAKVSVTIIAGSDESEFPLTVAPVAKTSLTLDERGWGVFLKETGKAKAPLHDLNKDGVRDYMDEFIFVANYLSNKIKAAAVIKKK